MSVLGAGFADELEIVTNQENFATEDACFDAGVSNPNPALRRGLPTFTPPKGILVFTNDVPPRWAAQQVTAVAPAATTTTTRACSGSHATLTVTGGACGASGFGNVLGGCVVTQVSFGAVVHYRIRPDPIDQIPSLWRQSTANLGAGYQIVARGIDDLQVQYVQAAAACTEAAPCDGAPAISQAAAPLAADYGTLITQVRVTLSARSTLKGALQGQTTIAGVSALRGPAHLHGLPQSRALRPDAAGDGDTAMALEIRTDEGTREGQMTMSTTGRQAKKQEAGFALIVALLTLLLLTFLGLTLATTTSTELQIANNYRWSQQAYYNAEAGLELAKRFLRGQTVWSVVVPAARTTMATMALKPTWTLARPDQYGGVSRNWENFDCDQIGIVGNSAGYQGYGVVLDFQNFASPYQTVSNFLGQNLNGTFTVWVRRLPDPQPNGDVLDYAADDRLLVTAEGTAPFVGAAAGSTYAFQNRAVRVLETEIRKIDPNDCENLSGQAGSGPTGSGFDPCAPVDPKGIPGATGEPAAVANQN